MEKDGFSWWIRLLKRAQSLFDEFRIDHFRGFSGVWAVYLLGLKLLHLDNGRWVLGNLYLMPFSRLLEIRIIAEDLGVITEDVVQLRKSISALGMAVHHFAFIDGADSPHLPHNHERTQVVYTGTHDNDTTRGWWDSLKDDEKANARWYLPFDDDREDISWILIHTALSSVARTTIIPMQDILGLDSSTRMNLPSTVSAVKLKEMLSIYRRI